VLDRLSSKFSDLFRQMGGKATISEKNIQDAVEEIKLALLEADVNLRVVRRFVNATIKEATGEHVLRSVSPGQQFIKIVHDRIVGLLGDERADLQLKGPDTTSVILLLGLQGSGKTTTASKLAKHIKKQGRRPMLVAADLVRPAAVDQLVTLGANLDIEVYHEVGAKDPVKVAKAGLKEAKKGQFDTVIIDTSGRMHVDDALMKELKSVYAAVKPDETLLVADAMTGQHAVDIAKNFDEALNLSGVILSKFDSDTRGGAALSLKSITGKAIKFIGVGEKADDLEAFIPERIASRILGMGDVVSLVEKAQETIDEQEAIELQKKMASKNFTLEDYLDQFSRMRKMGGLEKIMDMMPGMQGAMELDDSQQKAMKQQEAIILSMTRQERQNHTIIGTTRRKRIARGSGTSVHMVNKLIKDFEKMRLMMKKAAKNKKYQQQMMQQLGV
jgi:signal recognition particle subunit SRP54